MLGKVSRQQVDGFSCVTVSWRFWESITLKHAILATLLSPEQGGSPTFLLDMSIAQLKYPSFSTLLHKKRMRSLPLFIWIFKKCLNLFLAHAKILFYISLSISNRIDENIIYIVNIFYQINVKGINYFFKGGNNNCYLFLAWIQLNCIIIYGYLFP